MCCVLFVLCILYSFVYVYLFLFVSSVLVYGLLPPSDSSIAASNDDDDDDDDDDNNISFIELDHLLTRSGLTYPGVFLKIYHDSTCQLENSVSLPWLIYFEAFNLHVVSSFSCMPVICPKLVLFLTPLQIVHLFCNLSKCILLFFSCISSLLLLFF